MDEEYIEDKFNLTGLNAEVQHYGQALDLIRDAITEDDIPEDFRDEVDTSARHLYGLIHARYILTARGLAKMVDKFRKDDVGRCPRVNCAGQALLPIGLSDMPYQKAAKLYCPRCEDIYTPKSTRHGCIDGAYFGTTFPHMLLMIYPELLFPQNASGDEPNGMLSPGKTAALEGRTDAALRARRYEPKIFGFKMHDIARLQQWQETLRDEYASNTSLTIGKSIGCAT